jgi:transglutaminase-like putative cysteine protease
MSTGAQVAILVPGRRTRRVDEARRDKPSPLVQPAAFAALGLYGVLRWATLLHPVPVWRLIGLLGLALLVATVGGPLARRNRALAIAGATVAVLAMFAVSGIRVSWIVHVRAAVTADGIGEGLSALRRIFLPYTGINDSVRTVIVLGAGVLLLDAGLMLAFAPRALGDLRRVGAALPLVALAIVPATLVRPKLPYLQGLILFGLLAIFVWGERLRRSDAASALAVAALAGIAAIGLAPALDRHQPWLDYQGLAGAFAPQHVESFSWPQTYGPLNWPRSGRVVLDVRAQQPEYWKAVDLDLFDGTRWTAGQVQSAAPVPAPDPAAVSRWTQTIQVTIRSMTTINVIAAGSASQPEHVFQGVVPGLNPGTWTAGADLGPGDSYSVGVYSPHPGPAQLAGAGTHYPSALAGDLAILLPRTIPAAGPEGILFPPFHSGLAVQSVIGVYGTDGAAIMRASPYARAFALAQRLAAQAATPYGFVKSVQQFLQSGYAYDENPPQSSYPLESFLFNDRLGYCQQFSGAMALLLRMGGVPARVAAGFTSGTRDSSGQWVVTDYDAHAWVEAWFPHYGWVTFDPTPAAAPARGGHVPQLVSKGAHQPAAAAPPRHRDIAAGGGAGSRGTKPAAGDAAGLIVLLLAIAAALVAAALATLRRRRAPTGDELLGELERALARAGRPLSPEVTLASLEYRFRTAPGAASYVRAIRMTRFGGADRLPSPTERRALRAALAAGLGLAGRVRALWALPPRLHSK